MSTAPQLVVTLGPASAELVRELVAAGATSLRLNASHLDEAALVTSLERVRRAAPSVPVVVDLQGAKMRVGDFEPRAVAGGEPVRFTLEATPGAVPLPHPELFDAVRVGEVLSCDDDRLRCEVEAVGPGELLARWLGDGTLAPRKGINRAAHPVDVAGLSARDAAQVEASLRFGPVSFAWSFMTDGREAAWLRRAAPGVEVIGKVERAEAVADLDRVLTAVDALWICRGDLGAQLGPAALARFVAHWKPPAFRAPTFLAGQVLHHLTQHMEPTRSEVCHLLDVLERGYAGIVLSDETAVGVDPVNATRTARRLLDELGDG